MGGYNSGGHRWGRFHPTAEACYRLDAAMLRNLRAVAPGAQARGGWVYSSNYGDRAFLTLEYIGGEMFFMLRSKQAKQENGADRLQKIYLSFSPCRFGGRRMWLHCPACGARSFRLYSYLHLVDQNGAPLVLFRCRRCAGVWYDSQRESNDYHRLKAQAGKIKKRLGGDAAYMADFPGKPKGMRWNTYNRLFAKWYALETHADATWAEQTIKRFAHLLAEYNLPAELSPKKN